MVTLQDLLGVLCSNDSRCLDNEEDRLAVAESLLTYLKELT